MEELEAGLYELLITARIRQRIEALRSQGIGIKEDAVPKEDQADLLARHVGRELTPALTAVRDPTERFLVANRLLELAASLVGEPEQVDLVEPGPRELEGYGTNARLAGFADLLFGLGDADEEQLARFGELGDALGRPH